MTVKLESNSREFTKAQLESIANYHNEIKSIELFTDAVRKRPGEYLSSIGNEGWMNAMREVIQNSTDEMCRENTTCTKVIVEYFEGICRTIVSDNGRGIEGEDIVRVFTKQNTSANYVSKKNNYTAGLHGVGAKCTNAVSRVFKVNTYRVYQDEKGKLFGKAWEMEFSEGRPTKKFKNGPKEIPNKKLSQGTVIDFEPDFSIMKEITINCGHVLEFLENLVPLLKIGAVIEYFGHKANGTVIHKNIVNTDGVITYIKRKTTKPLIPPIIYGYNNGTMKCDIALTYVPKVENDYDVVTFANMTPVNTQLSTPSQGFFRGLCDFFRNYMNKIYLVNRKNLDVINSDITTGLIAAVTSSHIDVMFSGQAKNVCKNDDLLDFVKHVTYKALVDWSKKRPDDLQKVAEFLKDVATARKKADKEKINISKKYKTDSFVDLPKGFKKAEKKDHLELFIVEGKSAAGPCNSGRDPSFQAIFPIRGKLPNAFSTSREKFLANEEIQGILAILKSGYGKNFDISKCPYDKVILLADADYDGYHIRTLLLKFLVLYARPLVEAGRVYIGLSPLYHVGLGTKRWRYFIDKDDFMHYVRDEFVKTNTVKHIKDKKPFTKSQLSSLIINNSNYDLMLFSIAENYALDPVLLEDLMIARSFSYPKFKKAIEGKYQYVKVTKQGDSFILDGIVNDKANMIIFNQNLINACKPILYYIDKSEKRYILNNKKVGLYELISEYRNSEPKDIDRAKGLGTLNDSQIGISTLNPKNRKLLRYTADDINKEIEEMRKINDDKFSLIKDVDISLYEF